ncbi:hypothetical protein Goari_023549 [Gossypium aridum]|uniref:Uncharacterized protein n=1 Tax=Gossypium aridum TaxID=34290 RepID=A0A7J8X3T3_GOSAI|nr:hypothetical protein [Gossypium aridum]
MVVESKIVFAVFEGGGT